MYRPDTKLFHLCLVADRSVALFDRRAMAIQITNVEVMNNPSPFNSPFEFEITFDCSDVLSEGKILFFPVLISIQSFKEAK